MFAIVYKDSAHVTKTQCGYKVPGLLLLKSDKREHIDRSLPNEDTKFQYFTMRHRIASNCFRMRSLRRSSWKYIVNSGRRSSFVLKMNWRLQKRSKCCKNCTVMNVYLVQMFLNGMVNLMAERVWMMICEWDTPEPVEDRNTLQKYALLWQMIDVKRSECRLNSSTLI